MQKLNYSNEFFNIKDTLECGQVFRYVPENAGYYVFSADKACYVEEGEGQVTLSTDHPDYFKSYFDLDRDYGKIFELAKRSSNEFLIDSATAGKGIRILRQSKEEVLFSFIISQNNNIPRIRGSIEKLCTAIGEGRNFAGREWFTFPTAQKISKMSEDFFKGLGLGYRAQYFVSVSDALTHGFDLEKAAQLPTPLLKRELMTLKGVGPKVADCICLFGFGRGDSFPVDTWMEKIYREDYGGTLTDRNKIAEQFVADYGEYAGYFQQYMFHFKRNVKTP